MNQATAKKGGPVKTATHVRCGLKITRLGQPAVTKKVTEKIKVKQADGTEKEVEQEKLITLVPEVHKEETMYKSINEAKRASRKLQLQLDRALGRGSVRTKEHKPHNKKGAKKAKGTKSKYLGRIKWKVSKTEEADA